MLSARLARWGIEYGPTGKLWARAAEIAQQMQVANDTFGPGPDGSPYYLNHGDLYPRNSMVRAPAENLAFVTGILDWDDAHFAPAVVSFVPPAWLWMAGWWRGYDEEGYLEEEDL